MGDSSRTILHFTRWARSSTKCRISGLRTTGSRSCWATSPTTGVSTSRSLTTHARGPRKPERARAPLRGGCGGARCALSVLSPVAPPVEVHDGQRGTKSDPVLIQPGFPCLRRKSGLTRRRMHCGRVVLGRCLRGLGRRYRRRQRCCGLWAGGVLPRNSLHKRQPLRLL